MIDLVRDNWDVSVINDPFQCVYIKNFLPKEVYESARRSFPSATLSTDFPSPGLKRIINQSHGKFSSLLLGGLKDIYEWSMDVNCFASLCHEIFPDFDMSDVAKVKFDFSYLPGDWGCVYPHPDTPKKIVTAVLYFPEDGWKDEWGGGMDMYEHKTDRLRQDWSYFRERHWDNVNTVQSFPYVHNAAVFLRRCGKSLHGVSPCRGESTSWRRSITIPVIGSHSHEVKVS